MYKRKRGGIRFGCLPQLVDKPIAEEKDAFATHIKSFAQAFSKACGVQRQRLWSRSAEREIPLIVQELEGFGCLR